MRGRRSGVEDRWNQRDGTPTKVHGKGARWRGRYVDSQGQEHSRRFARKSDAQAWLDGQTAALETGTHVAPKDARLTVGQWADMWLEGYKVNRGLESPERYILQVFWDTLDDHMVGFRQSDAFPQWRAIVGPFFAAPPVVEHFDLITKSA